MSILKKVFKKSKNQRDIDRKNNRNKILMSLFIVFIMVASTLAIIFSGYSTNSANTITYNGKDFKVEGNYLMTKVNDTKVYIQSHPFDIERYYLEPAAGDAIFGARTVAVSVPVSGEYPDFASLAAYDLAKFLSARQISVVYGISDNNTGFETVPLISCMNSTESMPVIIFEEMEKNTTESNTIMLDGSCIRIRSATGVDMIRQKDRIVMRGAGIMN